MLEVLREAAMVLVAEVARHHRDSDQTTYRWRKRYGALDAADVLRLRQLEHENAGLKMVVADRGLELHVIRETSRKIG